MTEEVQDVTPAEETAQESSPETNQQVDTAPVSEDDKTQPEEASDSGEKQTVPLERFREVIQDRNELRERMAEVQPTGQQQAQPEVTDPQVQARETLSKIVEEAVNKAQAPQRQLSEARTKYDDFDKMHPYVNQVLEARPELNKMSNPIDSAYMIAKGVMAQEGMKQAKEQGKTEALRRMDQKQASRPGQPLPKKSSGGDTSLLKKYKAGKLSPAQIQANWGSLQEEVLQSQQQ